MIACYEVLKYRRRLAKDRLQFSRGVLELLPVEAAKGGVNQIERRYALHKCMQELEPKQTVIVKAVYEYGPTIKSCTQYDASPLRKQLVRFPCSDRLKRDSKIEPR